MTNTKDIKLNLNNIQTILSKLTLPQDQTIQILSKFKFFDGFVDSAKSNESIIALNYKDKPQEIIKFALTSTKIAIQYIQRVGNDLIKHKEDRNLLLESLIFASIPILKIGYKFTCEKIPFIKELYDFLLDNPAYKSAYSRDHLKREIDIYAPIRDRYFTKEGTLNFKKKKVLLILNNYNTAKKNKSFEFPKISNLRKQIKPKSHFL